MDVFDDAMEDGGIYDENVKSSVAAKLTTRQALEEAMPTLLDRANSYKEKIENCDKNIKTWQNSKKMWQGRSKYFLDTLEKVLTSLNIPGKTLKVNDIKLATTSRTSLEVDEEWLLAMYQTFADALQTQLPEYVKVSLSIDKNKLFSHVKQDNTMLLANPDKIHTKSTTSTSIK